MDGGMNPASLRAVSHSLILFHSFGTIPEVAKCRCGSSGFPFACSQHLQKIPDGEDIYDHCLTQAEIQGSINLVNSE